MSDVKQALAFFGAFNPPTVAHLRLAEFALGETGREQVIFVPSKSVYIRDEQGKDFAYSDEQRLAMLCLAAQTRPWMAVTGWEMTRPRQPRTYETLCHLRTEGIHAALLMGSDKLPELEHGWQHVMDIAKEFGIVCLSRGGDECRRMIQENDYLRGLASYITVLETPEETKGVSSTQVRRRMLEIRKLKEEISAWTPKEILPMLLRFEEEQP
jgi:nicotinate (nicotinamide) nucleotide adenylyltransferase